MKAILGIHLMEVGDNMKIDYDIEFLGTLQRAITTLDELDTLIETNGDRQSKIDLELSDWLHKLQYDDTLTNEQITNIGIKIKELRKERESLRNEHELIEEYNKNKNKLIERGNRQFLTSNIQIRMKRLNQPYNNRVLTEEDINKVINNNVHNSDEEIKTRKKYVFTNKETIRNMLLEGYKAKEVANELGCSLSTVYYVHRDLVKEGQL